MTDYIKTQFIASRGKEVLDWYGLPTPILHHFLYGSRQLQVFSQDYCAQLLSSTFLHSVLKIPSINDATKVLGSLSAFNGSSKQSFSRGAVLR